MNIFFPLEPMVAAMIYCTAEMPYGKSRAEEMEGFGTGGIT